MSAAEKDTIYIDVDDEITNIIDKVSSSKHKIVALVLPKRATVLQSIVNMKLLKRSVDNAKKSVVLITSESGLLPLAGAVGLHVARNLQTKPAIPSGPDTSDIPESLLTEEEIGDEPDEPELDNAKSVGELSGSPAEPAQVTEEPIELDDEPALAAAPATGRAAKKASKKADKANKGKDHKLKVPNFDRFRKILIFGGLALVLLIIFGYMAIVSLPKAHISIDTDSSELNAKINFTASTTTQDFDIANKMVPAQRQTTAKTDSQTITATGQQNNGNKASGSITIVNCTADSSPVTIPSGTGVSANNLTYITQSSITLPGSAFTVGGNCKSVNGYSSGSVNITAQNGGANYNTDGSVTFTVAGVSSVTASGKANGGTDNIQTVVSQADIDGAKSKFTTNNNDQVKNDLISKLRDGGFTVIDSSFHADGPNITTSVKAGDQVGSFTVTATTNYSILGINQANLKKFVADQLKGQINSSQQAILSDGLSKATYTVEGTGDNPKVSLQTTAVVGPNLDTDAIKRDIAGKKKGDTINLIESRPSIKGVTVNYSPFWVTKTPSKPSKIIITFDKADN